MDVMKRILLLGTVVSLFSAMAMEGPDTIDSPSSGGEENQKEDKPKVDEDASAHSESPDDVTPDNPPDNPKEEGEEGDDETTETAKKTVQVGRTDAVKKSKTSALIEGFLGYDCRINDIMLGAEASFGTSLGKITAFKANDTVDGGAQYAPNVKFVIRTYFAIAFMARLGYLVTPQAEVYLTGGIKSVKRKLSYSDTNGKNGAERSCASKKFYTFPVFGAGIRYEITPSIFTKLEYNFEFSKKFRIPKDIAATVTGASVKARSHVVKLGVGYRF